MKILAILQNTWAKDPQRVHYLLDRNRDRRHEVVARLLFASGCLTGRRILTVFGESLKEHQWTFENASTVVTGNSGGRPPYNVEHVKGVIGRFRPDAIITFGTSAKEALRDMQRAKKQPQTPLPPTIECIHPAVQKPGWLSQMVAARVKLEEVLNQQLQPA
jgi:hypothetical protein